jgi:hypothetical protein
MTQSLAYQRGATFFVLIQFSLAVIFLSSCAQDRNRKDRLTRIHAAGKSNRLNKNGQNTGTNPNAANPSDPNAVNSANPVAPTPGTPTMTPVTPGTPPAPDAAAQPAEGSAAAPATNPPATNTPAAPATNTPAAPATNPPAAEASAPPPEKPAAPAQGKANPVETTTDAADTDKPVCKISDGQIEGLAEITADESKLSTCGRMSVETDANGKIRIFTRLGGQTELAPYEINNAEYATDADDKKLIRVSVTSAKKVTTAAQDAPIDKAETAPADTLYISYLLPHTKDKIDEQKDIQPGLYETVKDTGGEETRKRIENIEFAKVTVEGEDKVYVRILNPEAIQNINFIFSITYSIK